MSATAMLERLQEQAADRALSDAAMARAAYDSGEITWRDLQDVVSHLLLTVVPEFRSIDADAPAPTTRRCACGTEIPSRYRKCDSCLGSRS